MKLFGLRGGFRLQDFGLGSGFRLQGPQRKVVKKPWHGLSEWGGVDICAKSERNAFVNLVEKCAKFAVGGGGVSKCATLEI